MAAYVVYVSCGASMVLVVLWLVPRLQREHWKRRDGILEKGTKKVRVELKDNARTTVAQVISGVGLVVTVAVTLLQIDGTPRGYGRALPYVRKPST